MEKVEVMSNEKIILEIYKISEIESFKKLHLLKSERLTIKLLQSYKVFFRVTFEKTWNVRKRNGEEFITCFYLEMNVKKTDPNNNRPLCTIM